MQQKLSDMEGVANGKLPLSVNISMAIGSYFIFFGFIVYGVVA